MTNGREDREAHEQGMSVLSFFYMGLDALLLLDNQGTKECAVYPIGLHDDEASRQICRGKK